MFLKTLGPNGTRITVVSWKAGSRKGRSPYFGGLGFWRLLGRKGHPKGALLTTMKIENGTQNQLFRKVRRWDPLKTVPGSGFEKTWKIYEKTIGKSMVLDGPKPLKIIEKQRLFSIWSHSKKKVKKRYQRGSHKLCFLIQNDDMGLPGSTYLLILDVLVRYRKIIIFGRLPDGPKNRKNRALERQRAEQKCPRDRRVVHFWPGGPRGRLARAY